MQCTETWKDESNRHYEPMIVRRKQLIYNCSKLLVKAQQYTQKYNVKIISSMGIFILAYIFQLATPLHVAAAIFRKKSSNIVMDAPEAVAVAKKSGFVSLMTKILQGANVSGDFRTWKAGDTRTEFAALLNTVSGFAILGFLAFIGYIQHNYREMRMNKAMEKELIKITEYKENMYFEAVQDVGFRNGKIHGKGIFRYSDGKRLFHGEFQNEMRHGYGVYQYDNGSVYEGEWRNDVKHGRGVQRRGDGSIYHSGYWDSGERADDATCVLM